MKIDKWNIEEMTGYKPITTFWEDFSIADKFGLDAIKDTYNRAFDEWKSDYRYLTELSMVLNWKSWQHFENGNTDLSALYGELWEKADTYAYDNLNKEEKRYYFEITD